MRALARVAFVLGIGTLWALAGAEESTLDVRVEVRPSEATIGDPLGVRIEVTIPPDARLDAAQLGPNLGPFSVLGGSWTRSGTEQGEPDWVWTGEVVAFRTGELELPAIRIRVENADGTELVTSSEPVVVTVRSVLDPQTEGQATPELADLKAPASLAPDYRPVLTALGILGLLLLGSALVWWLQRRYGARLAAVPSPDDPFHRVPPHEWFYSELQKLLDRRLAEQGQVTVFFERLAFLVKRYLGGRYRVEIMQHTTDEVPARLGQAGAEDSMQAVSDLLGHCDRVKFAGLTPDESECRAAIEAAYRIVDTTKPRPRSDAPVQARTA